MRAATITAILIALLAMGSCSYVWWQNGSLKTNKATLSQKVKSLEGEKNGFKGELERILAQHKDLLGSYQECKESLVFVSGELNDCIDRESKRKASKGVKRVSKGGEVKKMTIAGAEDKAGCDKAPQSPCGSWGKHETSSAKIVAGDEGRK